MTQEKSWQQCEIFSVRNKTKSVMWLAVDKYKLTEGSLITLKHNNEMYRVEKIYDTKLTWEQLNKKAEFASLKD